MSADIAHLGALLAAAFDGCLPLRARQFRDAFALLGDPVEAQRGWLVEDGNQFVVAINLFESEAHLIAAAVNALPDLLDELALLRELREAVLEWDDELDEALDGVDVPERMAAAVEACRKERT